MRAPIDISKPWPKPFPPKPSDLQTKIEFAMKDKDGSGSVNSEEYGPGKMNQDRFRKSDTNNDGKLSYDEYKAGKSLLIPYERPTKPFPFPGAKLEEKPELVKGGAEQKEEPSFFKKALPWLALANPITAPIGLFSLAKKFFSKD